MSDRPARPPVPRARSTPVGAPTDAPNRTATLSSDGDAAPHAAPPPSDADSTPPLREVPPALLVAAARVVRAWGLDDATARALLGVDPDLAAAAGVVPTPDTTAGETVRGAPLAAELHARLALVVSIDVGLLTCFGEGSPHLDAYVHRPGTAPPGYAPPPGADPVDGTALAVMLAGLAGLRAVRDDVWAMVGEVVPPLAAVWEACWSDYDRRTVARAGPTRPWADVALDAVCDAQYARMQDPAVRAAADRAWADLSAVVRRGAALNAATRVDARPDGDAVGTCDVADPSTGRAGG